MRSPALPCSIQPNRPATKWCRCTPADSIPIAADRLITESRAPHPVSAATTLRSVSGGAMASIGIIEAVHELRRKLNIELQRAKSQMIDLLATRQLPPARGRVHGDLTDIDPKWWWAASLNYP